MSIRNRWFHKPVLYRQGLEKKPGWLELFYDLIFVAAFIQLGNGLGKQVTLGGFAGFAGIFTTMWLGWVGFTFFMNRFTVDDFVHRALVLLQMFAVGGMAISAADVLKGHRVIFAACFAFVLFSVAAMNWRAYVQVKQGHGYSLYWGSVFTLAGVFWLVSLFLPSPYCYIFWVLGVATVVTSPFSKQSRKLSERFPLDQEHLSERFGLLTLIVLGESFVKVLGGFSEGAPDIYTLGQAILALAITCSIWWIYFDDIAGSEIRVARFTPIIWFYGHLPLQIGITAVGVAVQKAVFFDLYAPAPTKYRFLLCGAMGLTFLATALIDSVTERREAEMSDRARVNVRAASGLMLFLLAPAGGGMSAMWFLGIIAAICIGQVIFDMIMAPFEAHEHGGPEATSVADLAKVQQQNPEQYAQLRYKLGSSVRKGTPSDLRRDFYFYLMEGSWGRVLGFLAVGYVAINLLFASIYFLVPGAIANVTYQSFADAFFFSVQTISTIGYGVMHPLTAYGHMIVTVEAAVGMVGVALATGLIFSKFSRPKAAVLFSNVMTIGKRNGVPTLVFRAGNARGDEIVDASVSVSVVQEEITEEGEHLRRIRDLELVRSRTPFFTLSWTVMHVIDDASPLSQVDWEHPERGLSSFIVTVIGHDGTYGQTVYARHIFYPEDVRKNSRFVDVMSRLDDGRLMIDYSKFHDTVSEY